jgi:hypothetical protein
MIVANTNYTNSLVKIEELKTLILELEKDIYNQIPQGTMIEYEKSKSNFLNSLQEAEIILTEFNNNE